MQSSRFFPLTVERRDPRSHRVGQQEAAAPSFSQYAAAFSPLPPRRRSCARTRRQQSQPNSPPSDVHQGRQQHTRRTSSDVEQHKHNATEMPAEPRRSSANSDLLHITTPTRPTSSGISSGGSSNNRTAKRSLPQPLNLTATRTSKCDGDRVQSPRKNKKTEEATVSTCTICLGGLQEAATVETCQHQFCRGCIVKWAAVSNSCPLCNTRFEKLVLASSTTSPVSSASKATGSRDGSSSSSLPRIRSRWFTPGSQTEDVLHSRANSWPKKRIIAGVSARQGSTSERSRAKKVIQVQHVDLRGVPDAADWEAWSAQDGGDAFGGEGEMNGGYEYDGFVVSDTEQIEWQDDADNNALECIEREETISRSLAAARAALADNDIIGNGRAHGAGAMLHSSSSNSSSSSNGRRRRRRQSSALARQSSVMSDDSDDSQGGSIETTQHRRRRMTEERRSLARQSSVMSDDSDDSLSGATERAQQRRRRITEERSWRRRQRQAIASTSTGGESSATPHRSGSRDCISRSNNSTSNAVSSAVDLCSPSPVLRNRIGGRGPRHDAASAQGRARANQPTRQSRWRRLRIAASDDDDDDESDSEHE
jgi:hypothetical protein